MSKSAKYDRNRAKLLSEKDFDKYNAFITQKSLDARKALKQPDKPIRRCLIANDVEFVLNGYQIILRQYFGYVDIAENGLAAFDLVKSNPKDFYDYIFLDINMPIMNGLDACEAITKYLREKSFQDLLSV